MPDVPKTVIERMRAAVPVATHPDADLLTAFAEQSLPVPERTTVLQHLARCSECREVVALALPPTEAVTAAATPPARSGWLTWPALRWGLVAAGVVIIASLGILRSRRIAAPSIAAYKGPEITIPEPRAQSSAPASTVPAAQPTGSSDKNEKLLAGADSPSSTTAVVVEPKVVEPNVVEPKTTARAALGSATTRSGYGAGIAGGGVPLLQQGPKMPAQWQQSNNNNLQLQSSNNSPQPGQSVAAAAARQIPPASQMTVEASGETPQAQTQNQEAQLRDQSAQSPATSSHGSLLKAKPAEPASVTLMSAGPGQIGGYVVDPFGAAVSNARITITPSGTLESVTATTNAQGAWLIAGLPTGNYKAQAEAPGFKTTVADLSYDASRPSTYSFTLNLGSVSETVAVSAQDVQVSTDTANIGSPGANREVSQAPLNGRNVTELTSLSPGLRWTITAAGALQRSLDQGHTWQTVDVSAAAAASLELAAQQPASSQALAQQKSAKRKVSKKEASAPNFRAVAAAGAEVWAGGSSGTLYHSIDAGNDWVRVQPSSNGSVLTGDIVSLDFPDSQHGKITTSTPEVWTTSDAGQTWQKQ
jgi:hypothetical protein